MSKMFDIFVADGRSIHVERCDDEW